jgi:hypothetical protein
LMPKKARSPSGRRGKGCGQAGCFIGVLYNPERIQDPWPAGDGMSGAVNREMAIFRPGRPDIGKLEKQRTLDELIELLGHPDREVQYQAIEAVTRLGDPRGIEALMALVANPSTDELIRAKAWLALDVGWEREARKRTSWK